MTTRETKIKREDFSSYIRQRRLDLGFTQEEVAKKARVAQNFIAYIENRQRKPSLEMIRKLSEILLVPVDKLYFLAHSELEDIIHFDAENKKVTAKLSPLLEELKNDQALRKRHEITEEEIEQLASIRGRGEIKSKEDYVFLLMTLRQVFR